MKLETAVTRLHSICKSGAAVVSDMSPQGKVRYKTWMRLGARLNFGDGKNILIVAVRSTSTK